MRWGNVSSFSVGADYTRVFKCIHRSKSEELRLGEQWRLYLKNRSAALFLCFRVGNSRNLAKNFRYTLYKHERGSFVSPVNSSLLMMLLCLI